MSKSVSSRQQAVFAGSSRHPFGVAPTRRRESVYAPAPVRLARSLTPPSPSPRCGFFRPPSLRHRLAFRLSFHAPDRQPRLLSLALNNFFSCRSSGSSSLWRIKHVRSGRSAGGAPGPCPGGRGLPRGGPSAVRVARNEHPVPHRRSMSTKRFADPSALACPARSDAAVHRLADWPESDKSCGFGGKAPKELVRQREEEPPI